MDKEMIKIGRSGNQDAYINMGKGNNAHMLFIGESGAGKSVLAQRMMANYAMLQKTVVVFDINGSFGDDQIYPSVRQEILNRQKDIDVYKNGMRTPMFDREGFCNDVKRNERESVYSIASILNRIVDLKVRQNKAVRDALKVVYEDKLYIDEGLSAVARVLEVMNTTEALGALNRLLPITEHSVFFEGAYGFERGKINVLRLSKFPSETQRLLTNLILAFIWESALQNRFKEDGLFIFLDEAQNFGFGRNSPISSILTEGRKLNVNLVTTTQFLPIKRDERFRLLQSSFIACFRPAEEDVIRMAKIIYPSDSGKICYILRTLKCGEYVVTGDFIESGSLEIGGIKMRKSIKIKNDLDSKALMEELTRGSIKSCSKEVI